MSPGFFLLAVISGWIGGGLVNWAADILPGLRDRQEKPTAPPTMHSLVHYWTLPWFFVRHGICPHCHSKVSWRSPAVEVVSISLFVLMAVRWGWTLALPVSCLYGLFLIAVTVIDFEHHRVLNVMLAPAALVVAVVSLLPLAPGPLNMLLGGAVGFGVFLLLAIIGRGALGMGDVKLAGVVGMMTGYPGVLTALAIGAILGAVAALLLLASRKATRKTAIAYAPYLAVGALVTIWTMGG